MKRFGRWAFLLLFLLLVYFLFWPVPIAPQPWGPPVNAGYSGAFTANDGLKRLSFVELGGEAGPEDAALSPEGALFLSVHSGKILKLDKLDGTGRVSVFAEPKGRVLGLEFGADGALYAADAYQGLLKLGADGSFQVLANKSDDGVPIRYANDLDVTKTGLVYFTDSSMKFSAKAHGGTLPASLLDIAEHGGHGRVLRYDPVSGLAHEIMSGVNFANGVALSAEEDYLLVAETAKYRILKLWLKGEKAGQTEVLLSNLPGFPDNLKRDRQGHFWTGLVSPRAPLLDFAAPYPFLRRVMMRLPAFLRPGPVRYGFALRFSGEGKVLKTLQDPTGAFAMVTGVLDGGRDESGTSTLVFTSLTEPRLGVLSLKAVDEAD